MKPNGYSYTFDTPTPCDDCLASYKAATAQGRVYYKLWEYQGRKLCRTCMNKTNVMKAGERGEINKNLV